MSIWRGSIIALVLALAAGVAAAQSSELGKITPAPASARFPANFPPADFSPLLDAQWGFPIGGFGGTCRNPLGQPVSCLTGQPATKCDRSLRPVIFVHGNTRDASDWADDVTMCGSVLASGGGVHAEFLRRGYCDDQLWSISYNGAATALCTSGAPTSPHAANEINVPDVYRFIGAVMEYTGSSTVDIVAHSLGVTIVRRMFFEFPGIKRRVEKSDAMVVGK